MGRAVCAVCAAALLVAACGGGSPTDAPTPVATAEPQAGSGSGRSGAEPEGQPLTEPGESSVEPDLEAPLSVEPGESLVEPDLEAPLSVEPVGSSAAEVVAPMSEAPTAADSESAVGGEEGTVESGTPGEAHSVAGPGEEAAGEPTALEAALVEARYKPLIAGAAPLWPFRGLVLLSHGRYDFEGEQRDGWVLRYWAWDSAALEHRDVPLPDLEIDCLGQVALVSHGELGMEFGGAPGAVSGGFWVPWSGAAEPVERPSGALLEEVVRRSSNVAVAVSGDVVRVGEGSQARDYSMRDPVRSGGERWSVQARHDGDLFVLTVHPAHLECMSGVSWVSSAGTGELAYCGANTAATAFVAPETPEEALVLPDPDTVGTYLSCPASMDLRFL